MSRITDDTVVYRAPNRTEHDALRGMARTSFAATFGEVFEPTPLSEFLDRNFGAGGTMHGDLGNADVAWFVAFHQSQPVGYAKLTPLRAPVSSPRSGALELQQIYVLEQWQGRGVAAQLMEWALRAARVEEASEIYLTVFDHNERAKRFYRRYGFAEVGRCGFSLGDRVYDDRIWRRGL